MSPIPKPAYRSFAVVELAFFWRPRAWPEIVARFGEDRTGSSDIRDAIIEVDDEGGAGFLRWHPRKQSWSLTDNGKNWVSKLAPPKALAAERDWTPSVDALTVATAEREATVASLLEDSPVEEVSKDPGQPAPAESPEDELARLAAEQSEDDG